MTAPTGFMLPRPKVTRNAIRNVYADALAVLEYGLQPTDTSRLSGLPLPTVREIARQNNITFCRPGRPPGLASIGLFVTPTRHLWASIFLSVVERGIDVSGATPFVSIAWFVDGLRTAHLAGLGVDAGLSARHAVATVDFLLNDTLHLVSCHRCFTRYVVGDRLPTCPTCRSIEAVTAPNGQ